MNKNNDVWNTLCPAYASGYFMDTTTNYSNTTNNNDDVDDVLKLYNMLTTTTMSLLLNDNNNKLMKEGVANTTIPKRIKKKRRKVLFTDLSCKDLNGQDMSIGYFSSSVGTKSESVVGSDETEGDVSSKDMNDEGVRL